MRFFKWLASIALILSVAVGLLQVKAPHGYAANPNHTLVGAIRWDAWVGTLNTDGVGAPQVGLQVEQTLGPNKYHFRLPYFGVETGTNSVQARQLTQSLMDQDIAFAKYAGIDYWAFCFYPDGSGMDTARNLYDSSTHKSDVKYTYILGTGSLPSTKFDWLVSKFQESNYQKVMGGRPLLYIFGGTGGYSAADITSIRNKATALGLANPYVVVMSDNSSGASSAATSIGADAISAYITWMGGGGAYSGLAAQDEANWNNHKATGKKVIPWVTTGMDTRPRYDNPVSWTSVGPNDWVQTAAPSEIAANLTNALYWVGSNSSTAEANAVIMYAWNEYDEGGWIAPTLFDGTERLDAIKNVLKPSANPANLALDREAYSSSSNWDASQTAAKAFDSNNVTNWQAASGSSYSGQWVQVDFGANTRFNQVKLAEYGSRTTGYRIEYWNGSSWTTAYTGTTIGSTASPTTVTFPTVQGTKARIYYTGGTYTPILYEFEISRQYVNLAAGKTYASSSNWDAVQTASKAFDGNLATNWQAALGSAYNGQWVEVNFGASTTFNRVVLSEFGSRTSGYRIEYWNGSSWATAYTGTSISGTGAPTVATFPGVTGTKARIYYTGGTNTPILYEFEVSN
ncbi:discoidin domain-containing protein [Paenibacillus lignilyticus]|uniref:Discoidin domain-containing protein n=1 Tax=Paenibacillus lignilyticus TaxID=1172615 RepID=A0ABS5CDG9_9BACL|nr:discoidin domain-containing protein [Paenibacillus lignilyticus]MBP3963163.1 discoidin domain-containing protein [Paenibacillus lignilyticus]